MSDLRDLYQEVILDHSKKPRNFRRIEHPSHEAQGHNRLCGDKLTVFLAIEDGVVRDVSFQGSGCAISTASASLMTEALKGRTQDEVEAMFGRFHDMLTRDDAPSAGLPPKLAVFSGVREYPARVKCATLAWHTVHAALAKDAKPASTE